MMKRDRWGAIDAATGSVYAVVRYNLIKGVFVRRTTCAGDDSLIQ
jgi:hypothetical protein